MTGYSDTPLIVPVLAISKGVIVSGGGALEIPDV